VSTVHLVVPDAVEDPTRPSGGNTYDRHLRRELRSLGWSVHDHAVAGFWTAADAGSFAALEEVFQRIPDDGVVLLDGLIASPAPAVLAAHARRLRLVVLVHMPLADRRERAALSAAAAVVVTSAWSRRRLLELHGLPAHVVHVAEPGVDAAELSDGTAAGGALLCVGAVTFDKGQDVLLAALASIPDDLDWRCVCVGDLDHDPGFADGLRRRCLDARVSFSGPLTSGELDRIYAEADLLVLPSRNETYGMVITEALARGLPVIASDVGGVTEAVGHGPHGTRPGLLVAPNDAVALAGALRAWLGDAGLRTRLRAAARARRESLKTWSSTAATVATVLAGAAR
jgi:glycosyltransferase involved in cell wall biosynthesis